MGNFLLSSRKFAMRNDIDGCDTNLTLSFFLRIEKKQEGLKLAEYVQGFSKKFNNSSKTKIRVYSSIKGNLTCSERF